MPRWTLADKARIVHLKITPFPYCLLKFKGSKCATVFLWVLKYPILGFGATATGDNGIPGAIWAQYPPSTSGAGSTVCADDAGNAWPRSVPPEFPSINTISKQLMKCSIRQRAGRTVGCISGGSRDSPRPEGRQERAVTAY